MNTVYLHEKPEIERFLRRNSALNIYSLGDLDEFFWPYTQWYGLKREGELKAIALLYGTFSPPVFLALAPPHENLELRTLVTSILPILPRNIYTHINVGLEDILGASFQLESFGIHHKMILTRPNTVQAYLHPGVVQIMPGDLPQVLVLYAASYSDNAFDPRMLETGQFFGIWDDDRLVSIAGIHVYSPAYRVAAIGNVTTHPHYRNRGLGKAVTAKLICSLLEKVHDIGLNVKASNSSAIHAYQQLGFEIIGSYHEMMATAKALS